ncbi:MAG: hypothetical protein KIT58_17435 [Planctomycetota bacterium]|nr:hypothetical protein [Planctomycetota bacterium]
MSGPSPSGALAIDPRYVEALVNRGGFKAKLGDLQGALSDYDEAMRLGPDTPAAAHARKEAARVRARLTGE